ncbi:EAL domain-containing protein [Vibrio sp. T187]|uniref:EAL domain-containing protein n=1 Tax=Vibrio TaxID=662 RepID=UPI0010C9DC3F|nr:MULTISPECIES: EAL domain-containing protein [Vibrio]MBW3694724.1 EAL domain-containing protein [Vibrio sp. T187]
MSLEIALQKPHHHWKGLKSVLAIQMLAIREGLLWILPCLMISSLILFVASIGEFTVGKDTYWVETLYRSYYELNNVFPILLTAALSYILAMQWRLPRPPIALISIVYLALFHQSFQDAQVTLTFELIISVLTPLYTIPLIAFFYRKKWLKVISSDQIGKTVKDSLNLIVPSIITGILMMVVSWGLISVISALLNFGGLEYQYQNSALNFGFLYTIFNSFLWFIGIHGYYALMPWIEVLQQAVPDASEAALGTGAVNYSMMAVFVFIGGCGATLGLVISLLCFSRDRAFRLIAMAALPLVLLNINEVLLFGLPIIFNPRLFWPFVIAPVVNLYISHAVLTAGWVTIPSVVMPFSSPIFLNSWLATQGDHGAVLLQLILVVVNVAIYTPFVLRMNKVNRSNQISFPFFDSSYSRRREEADVLSADKVVQKVERQTEIVELEQGLRRYSQIDFCMEYQPQVQQRTGAVISCEALIRAKDPVTGELIYPGAFLPYFEQANMMADIDLWAVKKVVSDLKVAKLTGVVVETSINITPDTLLNRDVMKRICRTIEPVAEWVNIEITEESLLADKEKVSRSLTNLRALGCKISIDDFGVGYSSLSYLSQFDVDAIKIDRSFVLSLDEEKGRKVFYAMLKVAQQLELDCVVEGVETQQQLDLIPASHSISVQGWYYSKSLSLEALMDYVKTSTELKPLEPQRG